MAHNRFERNTGCFVCQSCKRKTRNTGDNGRCNLCPECYEIAGQENAIQDNGLDWQYRDGAIAEIKRLKDVVRSKGGQI